MEEVHVWTSLRTVERIIAEYGEDEMREWLASHWSRELLDADVQVIRRLIPLLDLPRVRDRATTVLFAVDHDWADVLDAADDAACGFMPAFWRDAFERAQTAGSMRCLSWLLDRKGECIGRDAAEGLML